VPTQFDGKVAMITGAGSGIGRATAQAFAQEGARVIVSDISTEGGQETMRLLKEAGGEATFVRCDVTQPEEIEALIHRTVETYGRLDCAVNNAGIEGATASTVDYPLDVWNKVLSVNLTAPWLCMKYEIVQMLKQGGGAIVNIASILGTVAFAGTGAYNAAKHGLIGATRTAALEFARQGIRINAVCPGFIETSMIMERSLIGSDPQMYKRVSSAHPIGRMGRSEEIAAAVLWLCSDAASFVVGAAMIVDGGYTIR
jgi:NAD(P)-dependent dehydrogenase (short-subunit alcohol dehydrogenase family)